METTSVTAFLSIMAALSSAVQTLVEHVIKKRFKWLDTENKNDSTAESRRQSAIHLIAFVLGAALAYSVGLNPLEKLGVSAAPITNYLMAGLMISFGGSFFDEALGAVREFKKAQEKINKT